MLKIKASIGPGTLFQGTSPKDGERVDYLAVSHPIRARELGKHHQIWAVPLSEDVSNLNAPKPQLVSIRFNKHLTSWGKLLVDLTTIFVGLIALGLVALITFALTTLIM